MKPLQGTKAQERDAFNNNTSERRNIATTTTGNISFRSSIIFVVVLAKHFSIQFICACETIHFNVLVYAIVVLFDISRTFNLQNLDACLNRDAHNMFLIALEVYPAQMHTCS
jgi:hypothetical protein